MSEITCPGCDGMREGEIDVADAQGLRDGLTVTCDVCDGAGTVDPSDLDYRHCERCGRVAPACYVVCRCGSEKWREPDDEPLVVVNEGRPHEMFDSLLKNFFAPRGTR